MLSACAISMRCKACESYSRRDIRRASDADEWFTHFAVFLLRVGQRVFLTVRWRGVGGGRVVEADRSCRRRNSAAYGGECV